MGIPERKKRERDIRRLQIISAGEELFLKKGLENTTMDEVAASCELSKGTLYLYFSSKEALYMAIMLKALSELYSIMEENVEGKKLPPEKLEAVGEAYLQYYKIHPKYFKIITNYIDHQMFAGKTEIKEVLNEIYSVNERIWNLITKIIQQGIGEGFFHPHIKPIELAIILWTSSNGIIQFMDHIKNENHCAEGAFHAYGFDCEEMVEKTRDLIMSSILIDKKRAKKKGVNQHDRN